MTARIFVDTNIHVYVYDRANKTKARAAISLIDQIGAAKAGIISAQVLSEFFNTVTRKLPFPLSMREAVTSVEALLQVWIVAPISEIVVLEAIRGVEQHQLNFWDAQIWAAARLNRAEVILSEDFQDGRMLEGVRFANPFSGGFRLERWL